MRTLVGLLLCVGSLLVTPACGPGAEAGEKGEGGAPAAEAVTVPEAAEGPSEAAEFSLPAPTDVRSALPAPESPALTRELTILDEASSDFSKMQVKQLRRRRSLVFLRDDQSELLQTAIDVHDPDKLVLPYAQAQAAGLLFAAQPERVLVLGLGGGTLPRFFHRTNKSVEIDAVEIDPMVVQMAAKWFGVRPGERLRVFTEDAIAYIDSNKQTYDLIYVDAFLEPNADGADNSGIPLALRKRAILEGLRKGLSPVGAAVFNLHFRSGYGEQAAAIADVFPRRYMVKVAGSTQRHIIAVADGVPELSLEELKERAALLDEDGRFGVDFSALVGQMSQLE